MPMRVLAPGSAHAGPYTRPPIDMSGNFLVHVSAWLTNQGPKQIGFVVLDCCIYFLGHVDWLNSSLMH